jgi:hypothetical protein
VSEIKSKLTEFKLLILDGVFIALSVRVLILCAHVFLHLFNQKEFGVAHPENLLERALVDGHNLRVRNLVACDHFLPRFYETGETCVFFEVWDVDNIIVNSFRANYS